MTDTTLFTPQAQKIEQTIPAIDVMSPEIGMEQPLPNGETPEISPQTITPVNEASPAAPNAPIPAVQPAKPVQEEEELDELIIEDFTIDGICGVY